MTMEKEWNFVIGYTEMVNDITSFYFAMKPNLHVMEFSIPVIRIFGPAKTLMKLWYPIFNIALVVMFGVVC